MAVDFRKTSSACPSEPLAEWPLVDQLALQSVVLGGQRRIEQSGVADLEELLRTGVIADVMTPYLAAAVAAGVPKRARAWVVPYALAMEGWYLIGRGPGETATYGVLTAFEWFGGAMAAELPFLTDFARNHRVRLEAAGWPI
jgi:hypothetical protein